MVTTGGEVKVVDVYISGGGPLLEVVSRGLVEVVVFTGPSSAGSLAWLANFLSAAAKLDVLEAFSEVLAPNEVTPLVGEVT